MARPWRSRRVSWSTETWSSQSCCANIAYIVVYIQFSMSSCLLSLLGSNFRNSSFLWHLLTSCHTVTSKSIERNTVNTNEPWWTKINCNETTELLINEKFHEMFISQTQFHSAAELQSSKILQPFHPSCPKSQWTVCVRGNSPGIHGVTGDPGRRSRWAKGSAAEKDISSPCRGGRRSQASELIHPDIISPRLKSVCRDPEGKCFHSSNILTKALK